ncbi:MAG: TIGR02221 family CRISPR-associated protein [Thermoguttaceae bacterium]
MTRKIFISFLGTSDYKECVYQLGTQKSSVVKYVQSAFAELFIKEQGDHYFVFTTQKAIETNWSQLQQEIQRLTPSVSLENVLIPEGSTIDEIWQTFQTIFDKLEEGDELTVDITHSFRSIPLLASALLQYAKFLKNISVKGIYYGAFETLGPPKDIAEKFPNPQERIVLVFDLTAFSDIQDWSTAANEFITFGNTKQLSRLTKGHINKVVSVSGVQPSIPDLNTLNNQIEKLSGIIKMNRGKDIISGSAAKKIIEILTSLEQSLIPVLNPILEKLKTDVETCFVEENDVRNMIGAVKWCIDKQLIQEGCTILEEGIITMLLPQKDWCNINQRFVVSGYLQYPDCFENKSKLSEDEVVQIIEHIKSILGENLDSISKTFKSIADVRNDINHAGMNCSPMSANNFAKKLCEFSDQVESILTLR